MRNGHSGWRHSRAIVAANETSAAEPRRGLAHDGSRALSFRPDIEGLRAVAILLVVAAHAGVPWLAGGFIGVDVFFVLSGFLITGTLVQETTDTGRIRLLPFYVRRLRRFTTQTPVVRALGPDHPRLRLWRPFGGHVEAIGAGCAVQGGHGERGSEGGGKGRLYSG